MRFFRDKVGSPEYTEDDLETYLNLNITLLSLASIFVGLNGNRDFKRFGVLAKIPILTIMTVILAISNGGLQFLWSLSIMSTDIETAILLYTNVFSNISCVNKGVCLIRNRVNLQLLLDSVSKMWNDNRPRGEIRKRIIERANKTVTTTKGYIWMIITLIANFGIPPLQHMIFQYIGYQTANTSIDYSIRIFPVKYPFDVNTALVYYSILCYEFWILFGLGCCWLSCDTLFASLTTHLSIQFEILEDDIQHLIGGNSDEVRLKKNLIIFVNRHREILRVCKEVEKVFSPVIFITIVVSSLSICVNTYMVQEYVSAKRYLDGGYHFFLALNTFLQIIVYCAYAESLTESVSTISNAIYDCDWSNKSQEFKICVQILLMKTQKPFYYKAYSFFELSHQQLTKIVNTAVSYYMMLRTTSE